MKAYVEVMPLRRKIGVWLYEQRPGGTEIYSLGKDGQLVGSPHSQGARLPDEPTYMFDRDVFEEIVREAAGIVPPSQVQHEALVDARAVRDRLLALVEKGWPAT